VIEAGITLRSLRGEDIEPGLWRILFAFSERTFLRHGNGHYLNAGFFADVSRRMPGTVVVKLAERAGAPLAAAIFMQGGGTLYGRYWGAVEPVDCLHFECCYYQMIEFAIERGLAVFEGGAQGEHKLARGFEPVTTFSSHWLSHPVFNEAVQRYLEREHGGIEAYVDELNERSALRRDSTSRPGER